MKDKIPPTASLQGPRDTGQGSVAKPDWSRWLLIPRLRLWEAVALSCDIEPKKDNRPSRPDWEHWKPPRPDSEHWEPPVDQNVGAARLLDELFKLNFFRMERRNHPNLLEFEKRLEIAVPNFGVRFAVDEPRTNMFNPACPVWLSDFARWIRKTTPWALPAEFSQAAIESATTAERWPWGTYSTALLGHLEAAVRKYSADFEHPETTPKKLAVLEWLEARGLSENQAKAIALIIGPDHLRPGLRPKSQKGGPPEK